MSDFFDGIWTPNRTAAKVLITPEVMMKIGSLSNCNAMLQARATIGTDRFSVYCSKCGSRKVIPSVDFSPSSIPEEVVQFCSMHKHSMDVIPMPVVYEGRKFKEDA